MLNFLAMLKGAKGLAGGAGQGGGDIASRFGRALGASRMGQGSKFSMAGMGQENSPYARGQLMQLPNAQSQVMNMGLKMGAQPQQQLTQSPGQINPFLQYLMSGGR